MQPYVNPTADQAEFSPSRRGGNARQSRLNYGTLNIFVPDSENACGGRAPAVVPSLDGKQSAYAKNHQGHRYHNQESTVTNEFPPSGLRHLELAQRVEGPQGIRHLGNVPASRQNIEVVNISAAYKDPAQMAPVRPSLRVHVGKRDSSDVKDSLAYGGTTYDSQLRGEVNAAPVGKARVSLEWRSIDYTRQEHFCQAVRDHVQQRARGATEFYVQLCRGGIGGVPAPAPTGPPRLWSLEHGPEARTLTLASCRAQLVALTRLPISLLELADILWVMAEYKQTRAERGPASEEEEAAQEAAELGPALVPYKDFSTAFGANSANVRLAVKKI